MTDRVEMVMNKIEELENNDIVVCGVRFANGTTAMMEEIMDDEEYAEVVAIATVSLEAYEANGYDVDGLEFTYEEV